MLELCAELENLLLALRKPILMTSVTHIAALRSLKALLCIAIVVIAMPVFAQNNDFSKLVVFGDSLSDTGNLAAINLPFPYYENRISNGPVLADYIANAISSSAARSGHLLGQQGGFNYAVSGGNILGNDNEDLSSQVSAYLSRVNNTADPDALYLVFIGGNDLRDFRGRTDAEQDIALAISSLDSQLQRLVDAGARTFVVPNVANIGRLPETIDRESSDPGVVARAESHTRSYNQGLSVMLNKYRSMPNVVLSEFDLFSALEEVLNNPVQNGFTTVTQGCFDPSALRIEPQCLLFGFDSRPFFDRLHPSSATNLLISNLLTPQLPSLPESPSGESNLGRLPLAALFLLLLDE